MDIKKALFEAAKKLEKHSSTPQLDAEILLSQAIKKPREFILTHPEKNLTKAQKEKYGKFIKRRQKHEPIAYILGKKEFYGLDFKVTKNTLVPRPETELLVERALDQILSSTSSTNKTIIDIGTGSGNIIISIVRSFENNSNLKNIDFKFYGSDLSKKAIQVAKHNAKKNNVEKKINFLKSDLLEYFLKNNSAIKQFSNLIILANLPYLEENWKNSLKDKDAKGLKYEPDLALYSGEDGLDAYQKLSNQIKSLSSKNILLFCEIGPAQKPKMKKIFSFAKKIAFHKDLAGKWRFAEIVI